MRARERILAIRLLEKIAQNPDYAEKIGVEGRQVEKESKGKKQDNQSKNKLDY